MGCLPAPDRRALDKQTDAERSSTAAIEAGSRQTLGGEAWEAHAVPPARG